MIFDTYDVNHGLQLKQLINRKSICENCDLVNWNVLIIYMEKLPKSTVMFPASEM